jgi:serine/threonine protein kinase
VDLPPRKRPANQSPESDPKLKKPRPNSAPDRGGDKGKGKGKGNGLVRARKKETITEKEAHLQVGRYLLEQFAVPAFRSHVNIGLVDRDRVQFYHANRSVILVSSAIAFSTREKAGGVDKFIAIAIAFSRLSLRDSGILHDLHNGGLFTGNWKLPHSNLIKKAMEDPEVGLANMTRNMQKNNDLILKNGTRTLRLTYGQVISHEPSLVGRGTAVLEAKSATRSDLVVKISWPGSKRVAENEFLEKAIKMANSDPAHVWAVKHLPEVVFAQEVVFGPDSTHGMVAELFENIEFTNGEYEYEERTLRIMVQERLYPLTTLTDAKEIAQVLLDVGCGEYFVFYDLPYTYGGLVHHWLYEVVGILHRDLSPNNTMYRRINGKIYGVLTDFDLSSWRASLTSDYSKTSQQRTGTPPYMAYGLLDGSDPLHLYRHDLESLFYIMLMTATRYEIEVPKGRKSGGLQKRQWLGTPPFGDWFNQPSYRIIGALKRSFLTDLGSLDLSPDFEDFRFWLAFLRLSFQRGVTSKITHKGFLEMEALLGGSAVGQFDDETLGGHVCYSALIKSARSLKGKLEGLEIRDDQNPAPKDAAPGRS